MKKEKKKKARKRSTRTRIIKRMVKIWEKKRKHIEKDCKPKVVPNEKWIRKRWIEKSWKGKRWWENIAKDRKVIPDPIDDRKFHEWKESGKSGILLGITLNPKKCIGQKARRIPINVETKW